MADVPFLGCKISLISKCDIRYEGILYCVDPKESTIALSKVKSYGTETRGDPSNYVAPKNDVYDIIIFRASDVKDLRVDAPEPPGLSDPAIISARQSNTAFDGINNGSLPTSSGPSQQLPQQQKPLLPFLPTGSNVSKDQQMQPTTQQQSQQPTINYSSAVANAQRRARPDNNKRSDLDLNNKSDVPSARDGQRRGGDGDRRPDKRDDRRDDRRNDRRADDRRGDDRRGDDRRGDDRRGDDRRGDDRRGDDRRNYDRRDNDGRRGDGVRQTRVGRGGYDRNHVNSNTRYNNNSNYNNSRRGQNHRDENSKGGSTYRRGPMQGSRRGRSDDRTGAPRGSRRSAPLKFESEYDFDEANKQFLELEGKLRGLKLKSEDKDGVESSGDRANSKSPTGQSESGSGYDSEDQNNKDGDSKDGFGGSVSGEFYDRTKSFFDNISCEASERSQGKVNKPNWQKERQLNAETFGVSANYRRGGYRGRTFGANGYHRR